MTALSQTRAAVGHLARYAPAALTRSRALLLQEKLTACGSPLPNAAGPSPGLLRQVVMAVRDLAGPAWLHAHADDPGICAFTSLGSTPTPPSLLVLDEILARCLRARFGAHLPAR